MSTTYQQHNEKCRMAFGRPTKEVGACPRCDELRAGAPARQGYGLSRSQKATREAQFRASLKAHDCKKSNCSYICTFGDW